MTFMPQQPVVQVPLHFAGIAIRLAALLLAQIFPIFSVVCLRSRGAFATVNFGETRPKPWRRRIAPCQAAALPPSVRRRTCTTGCQEDTGRFGRRSSAFLVLVLSILAAPARSEQPDPLALDRLTIVAPAAAGGGWDQTARVMADVLESAGIAGHVTVVNSPGAGGAIALAEFINAHPGDGHRLMLGGLVMLGAIHANGATESMLQTTPLARLIAEPEVIAVRSDAPLIRLADVVAAMKSDPAALVWTGGSYGGVDHLLLQLVADAIGADRSSINYTPYAGGGEGLRALLSGQGTAGVGGYSEFAEGLRSGKLRAVAISSEKRLPNVQIPTLKEQGVDVALMNWRGAFAPPDLAPVDRERLAAAIDRMVHQPAWHRMLVERGWTDMYLTGEPYVNFVDAERRRIDEYFAQADGREHHYASRPARRLNGPWTIGLAAVVFAAMLGALWFGRTRMAASVRELALRRQLEDARTEIASERDRAREMVNGLGDEIDRQFDKWGLTAAEREVALLMLKGLRHKEIANARNTSEGTVRQQALMVYKKAGLDGRTDLAAFFLEDLLPPRDERPVQPASC